MIIASFISGSVPVGYSIIGCCLLAGMLSPVKAAAQSPAALPGGSTVMPTIVLRADENSGHHRPWSRRPYYGKDSWGIRGSRIVESGEIWFDSFPGPSGPYRLRWGVILEQDGRAKYEIKAGSRSLAKGALPYLKGAKDCDAKGEPSLLDLGVHDVVHGERISIWAESVYECPWRQGAYALWYELNFEPVPR